jgi:hypothetical protein
MSLKDQEELIVELGAKGSPIPGLNLESILKNLVDKSQELKEIKEGYEKEIEDLSERGEVDIEDLKKQAEDAIKQSIDTFIESMTRPIEEKIALIKQNIKIVKKGLENIKDDVKSAISQSASIATITATPGPGIASFTVETLKGIKSTVGTTLNIVIAAFAIVLKECTDLKFELPNSILNTAKTLDTVATLINTIPV